MILTSTGNNFGAEQIEFNAVLEENQVILNGKMSFDRSASEYRAVDVLEIYVPDMPMKLSMETAVFMTFQSSYDSCITVVRSWIKNRNTICLEKLEMNERFTDFGLHFLCAYLPKGQRDTFEIEGQIALSVENLPENMYCENFCAIVREKWTFICLGFENIRSVGAGVSFAVDLVNFPTSISAEVPLLAPMGYAQGWADSHLHSRIENGQFISDGFTEEQTSQVSVGFIKAFIVTE